MSEVLVICSCGFKGVTDSNTELYRHENITVCVSNCFKHSPNQFYHQSDNHNIWFVTQQEYDALAIRGAIRGP